MPNKKSFEEQLSDEKNISDGLHSADAYIRNVFLQAPVAIVVYKGPSFIIDIINDKALDIWETTRKQVLHKPLFEVSPQLQPDLELILTKVYTKGRSFNAKEFQIYSHKKDAHAARYFNLTFHPFRDLNGTITGITSLSTDVTLEVAARKKLEESRQHLDNIISQVSAGIAQTDLQGNFIYVNERFCEITGYSKEELLQRNILNAIHSDDLAESKRLFGKCLSDGKSFCIEKRLVTKSGAFVWVNNSVSLITGENGEQTITAVCIDITEPKLTGERQAYLLKLSDAIRSKADPVEIVETVTREAMDHFSADRCYYCTIEGENAIITQDARRDNLPSVAGTYPIEGFSLFKKIIGEGEPLIVHDVHTSDSIDEDLKKICRQLNLVSFVDIPIIKNGKAAGIFCLVQSVPRMWTRIEVELAVETAERIWIAAERAKAELKLEKSEKQLRQIKDQLELSISAGKIGVWNIDVKNNRLSWSKEQCELYGITENELEHTPDFFWKFISPIDRHRLQKESEDNFFLKKPDITYLFRINRKDGAKRWIESRSKTRYDATGNPVLITGINIDITESKLFAHELEQRMHDSNMQIEQHYSALQKIREELETVSFVLSHDLQEHLKKVQSVADAAAAKQDKEISGSFKDRINLLQHEASRLHAYIPYLQRFAKLMNTDEKEDEGSVQRS